MATLNFLEKPFGLLFRGFPHKPVLASKAKVLGDLLTNAFVQG